MTYFNLIRAIDLVPLVTLANGAGLAIVLQHQHDLPVPSDLSARYVSSRLLGSSECSGQIDVSKCAPPMSHGRNTLLSKLAKPNSCHLLHRKLIVYVLHSGSRGAYWPLGTQQRLVMEFALETASRKGEVVRLGPQHIRNGRIRIERTHGSEDVDIPISPELQAACDAMVKSHLTYIVTVYGKPRSKYGLGNDFAKWATAAGLPARCRLHGLKKSAMGVWPRLAIQRTS